MHVCGRSQATAGVMLPAVACESTSQSARKMLKASMLRNLQNGFHSCVYFMSFLLFCVGCIEFKMDGIITTTATGNPYLHAPPTQYLTTTVEKNTQRE